MSEQIISQEGYNKIRKELNLLTTTKRREIAHRIEKAKELGDLSENAEYSEAKDAQALNEGRVLELNNILKNVTIVQESSSKKEIGLGSRVVIKINNKTKTYTIVSFNEADPLEGKISNESPLGMAFIGKKKNDKVEVETPKGIVKYTIIKIS